MAGLLAKARYPVVRGMVSYALIWPTCSVVQEYIENGTSLENADWVRAARFGIFGTFFMAPVFYSWMKYTSRFFTKKTLATAMTRAAIEQVSYSPLAMAYFFFGMTALELKPLQACIEEVKLKFWPTYKYGVIFWPMAQTFNFYFISERNRIVFVSAASFVWTVYLAHMKAQEHEIKNDDQDILSGGGMLMGVIPSSVEGKKTSAALEGVKKVATRDRETSAMDAFNKVEVTRIETDMRVEGKKTIASEEEEDLLRIRIQEIESTRKGAEDIAAIDMEATIGEGADNIKAAEEMKTVVTEGVKMVAAEAGDRAAIESDNVGAGEKDTREAEEPSTEEVITGEGMEPTATEEIITGEGMEPTATEEIITGEGMEPTATKEIITGEGMEPTATKEIITGEGMEPTATEGV